MCNRHELPAIHPAADTQRTDAQSDCIFKSLRNALAVILIILICVFVSMCAFTPAKAQVLPLGVTWNH